MRDPDLLVRAQLAATALEGAWHRWRVVHGLTADPMPTVSSYVGYSLEEPWGQPRVVFGLAAQDAEQLAALLERHDCVGPVYAAVATLPSAGDSAQRSTRGGQPAIPRPRRAPTEPAGQPQPGDEPGNTADTPLFRQAAAIKEAAVTRDSGRNTAEKAVSPAGHSADRAGQARQGGTAASGSLSMAASAARAEAEARIRATLTDGAESDTHPSSSAAATGGDQAAAPAVPLIQATDVLEPLPPPQAASGASAPRADDESGLADDESGLAGDESGLAGDESGLAGDQERESGGSSGTAQEDSPAD